MMHWPFAQMLHYYTYCLICDGACVLSSHSLPFLGLADSTMLVSNDPE